MSAGEFVAAALDISHHNEEKSHSHSHSVTFHPFQKAVELGPVGTDHIFHPSEDMPRREG